MHVHPATSWVVVEEEVSLGVKRDGENVGERDDGGEPYPLEIESGCQGDWEVGQTADEGQNQT